MFLTTTRTVMVQPPAQAALALGIRGSWAYRFPVTLGRRVLGVAGGRVVAKGLDPVMVLVEVDAGLA